MRLLFNSPFAKMEVPEIHLWYATDKNKELVESVLDYAIAGIGCSLENTEFTRMRQAEAEKALIPFRNDHPAYKLDVDVMPQEYLTEHKAYSNEVLVLELDPETSEKLHFYDVIVIEIVYDLSKIRPDDQGTAKYIAVIRPKQLELFAQDVYELCCMEPHNACYTTHLLNEDSSNPTLLIPLVWLRELPDEDCYTLDRLPPSKSFVWYPSSIRT